MARPSLARWIALTRYLDDGDVAIDNNWVENQIRLDDRNAKADVPRYSAALYGGNSFDVGTGKLNVLAGTSYTWHNIDSERRATVAGAPLHAMRPWLSWVQIWRVIECGHWAGASHDVQAASQAS